MEYMPDQKASILGFILIGAQKINHREQDRWESRRDRNICIATKHVSQVAKKKSEARQGEELTLYICYQLSNFGFGGFVVFASKRGRDEDGADEAEKQQERESKKSSDQHERTGKGRPKGRRKRQNASLG